MKNRALKQMLTDSLKMEVEMYDFIKECLMRIYGEDGELAISEFDDGVDQYDNFGCLQGLQSIESSIQKVREWRANKSIRETEKSTSE